MSDKRYKDKIERLRSPKRISRFEIERVITICLDGIEVKSALDIGTGSGVFAEALNKEGLQVAGTDINPEMVAAAKQFVPAGQFEAAPAENQPFEDKTFDLVFMGCVFHEVDDYVETLREAGRLAKQRIAILEYPRKIQLFGPPLHHRLTTKQVKEFARQAGLENLKTVELKSVNLYLLDL